MAGGLRLTRGQPEAALGIGANDMQILSGDGAFHKGGILRDEGHGGTKG